MGDGVESAVFEYKYSAQGIGGKRSEQEEEDDMLDDPSAANGTAVPQVTVGISIEPAASVQAQLAALAQSQASTSNPHSSAEVVVSRPQLSTKVLAQRIAKNAFNFLASFAKEVGGEEVVSLKAFREWWERFERRVERDEGFLMREEDV